MVINLDTMGASQFADTPVHTTRESSVWHEDLSVVGKKERQGWEREKHHTREFIAPLWHFIIRR